MSREAKLKQILISAGIAGLRQRDITHRMRNDMQAGELTRILTLWKRAGYVQRFRLEGQAWRPTTMWRATDKILELEF